MPDQLSSETPELPEKFSIKQPKLLIGEGVDEVSFFNALLKHLGIGDIQVHHYDGKDKLSAFLQTLRISPDFSQLQRLGVTRDADSDFSATFRSICGGLQRAGLSVPTTVGIPSGTDPAVLVYIMPDNRSPGMLEDLCMSSVQADPAFECVEKYFECIRNTTARSPEPFAKAQVHAWLASQIIKPDKRLGDAAKAGYWIWENPAFAPLIAFLKSL